MATSGTASGPDLAAGVLLSEIPDEGVLGGHVGDDAVLLARVEGQIRAFSSGCTHYGGPLAEGLRVADTIRCPWHHACFSLRTGEALRAPAFAPLDRWTVEVKGGRAHVRKRARPEAVKPPKPRAKPPRRVVLIGGGGAGFACAERLRVRGFKGEIVMLSDDSDPPCDRPNLSKDYLAGSAPEEWIPLRDEAFYREQKIDLRLGRRVTTLDPKGRKLTLADGQKLAWDALLIATGAEPVRFATLSGPDVLTLRSLADCRAIIARAGRSKAVVIVGAGFIGMEAAASLRARGLEVHVVAPEAVPMQRALGPELGSFLGGVHQANGVKLHLGRTVSSFSEGRARLDDGSDIAADFVLLAVGVRPRIDLATAAGLGTASGVLVDGCMRTSVPGIWAAGDVAEYPDSHAGGSMRIEHWVVAERQGQTAADDMLGLASPLEEAPFFWTHQFDVEIRVSGRAGRYDKVEVDGSIEARDCEVRFLNAGRIDAVATIGRDRLNLERACAWAGERAG